MPGLAARLARAEANAPPCPTCRNHPTPHPDEPAGLCPLCRRALPIALTDAMEESPEERAVWDTVPREEIKALCRITDRCHATGRPWGTELTAEEMEERLPGQFYCRTTGTFIASAEDLRLQTSALERLRPAYPDE